MELLEPALLENGFSVLFEQFAMYLDLNNLVSKDAPVSDSKYVTSAQDIETWVVIASAAFGYPIDASVFHNIITNPDIRLLLTYCAGKPAGTALLYKTGEVIGVHLVGVPQDYRGRGIAKALMQQVIVDSLLWAGKYITLQASAAGEPLYRQLGFKHQFTLRNYQSR
jgi:GNAT superfamily N-acetyltransferase